MSHPGDSGDRGRSESHLLTLIAFIVASAGAFAVPTAQDGVRNTFVYDRRADAWQWHIDNLRSGAASVFARVTPTRQ